MITSIFERQETSLSLLTCAGTQYLMRWPHRNIKNFFSLLPTSDDSSSSTTNYRRWHSRGKTVQESELRLQSRPNPVLGWNVTVDETISHVTEVEVPKSSYKLIKRVMTFNRDFYNIRTRNWPKQKTFSNTKRVLVYFKHKKWTRTYEMYCVSIL